MPESCERVEHVVDEADDLAVDVVDVTRLRFQDRVTEGADLVRHADRLRAVTADGDDHSHARRTAVLRRRSDGGVRSGDDRRQPCPTPRSRSQTDRGVFARGQLDAGTSLLLRTAVPLSPHGHLLDVGCGAGPIALRMARRSPRGHGVGDRRQRRAPGRCAPATPSATASRTSACVRRTTSPTTCGSTRSGRIRRSASASSDLHALLLRWLARLTPAGSAALVVQKHLGADSLQRWLTEQGLPTERIASKAGYRILLTRRLHRR